MGDSAIDDELRHADLWRKLMPRDGKCILWAILDHFSPTQENMTSIERRIMDHQLQEDSSSGLRSLSGLKNCADHSNLNVFLQVIPAVLDCHLTIYKTGSVFKPERIGTNTGLNISLSEVDGHYDVVMNIRDVETAAFCQSLVYDVLYTRVLQIEPREMNRGRKSIYRKTKHIRSEFLS
ncbi:hypothetical protein AHF37_03227 [Paragonimus kellicotti]|nr:hypothetical protein AHF37_03227 [Paragonimus kellicotti]